MDEGDASRRRGLRQLLEDDFRDLVRLGLLADRGERELTFKLDDAGFIRWVSSTRVRAPASELETSP
jgi:hypothetical protein